MQPFQKVRCVSGVERNDGAMICERSVGNEGSEHVPVDGYRNVCAVKLDRSGEDWNVECCFLKIELVSHWARTKVVCSDDHFMQVASASMIRYSPEVLWPSFYA